MTASGAFLERLKELGFDFFTGVPDSTFAELWSRVENDVAVDYVPSVKEDAAIGLATGAYLGGRQPVVMMQNSGLGVSVNALTSLAMLYRVPLLMLIGWRGHCGTDAPEHRIMGGAMLKVLDALGLPYRVLDPASGLQELDEAAALMCAQSMPTALILRGETLT